MSSGLASPRDRLWRSRAFSAAAIVALLSMLLPWEGGFREAPLFVMSDWLLSNSAGDVVLGAGVAAAVLVVLLAVLADQCGAILDGRTTLRVAFVVGVGVLGTAGLGVFAFVDQLPERTPSPGAIFMVLLPRPIDLWGDPLRGVVRALLVAPPIMAAAVGTRTPHAARRATRVIAVHVVAGGLLAWSPMGRGIGYWTSVTAAAFMLVTVAALEWSSRWRDVWIVSLVVYTGLFVAISLPARAEYRRRRTLAGWEARRTSFGEYSVVVSGWSFDDAPHSHDPPRWTLRPRARWMRQDLARADRLDREPRGRAGDRAAGA